MSSIKKSTVLNKLGLGSTKRTQSNGGKFSLFTIIYKV